MTQLVLTLLALVLLVTPVWACECEVDEKGHARLKRGEVVFIGRLKAPMAFAHSMHIARLKPLKMMRNEIDHPDASEEEVILLQQSLTTCAMVFDMEYTYEVHAWREYTSDGRAYLTTNICSKSRVIHHQQ